MKCDYCGKTVEKAEAEAKLSYFAYNTSFAGAFYFYFCSLDCLKGFLGEVKGGEPSTGTG